MKPPAAAPTSSTTSAKAPPSGPARAVNGRAPAPPVRSASAAGTTAAASKTLSEQEALRQKVKETRAKTAASNVKEARRYVCALYNSMISADRSTLDQHPLLVRLLGPNRPSLWSQ